MTQGPAPTRGGDGAGFADLKRQLKKSPKLSVVAGMSALEQEALGSRDADEAPQSPVREAPRDTPAQPEPPAQPPVQQPVAQRPVQQAAPQPAVQQRPVEQPVWPAQSQASPHPVEPSVEEGKQRKKKKDAITFYVWPEDAKRARDTYRATGHLERLSSFSDFVHQAVVRECQRLEQLYNNGEEFEGLYGAIPRGRPLKSDFDDQG